MALTSHLPLKLAEEGSRVDASSRNVADGISQGAAHFRSQVVDDVLNLHSGHVSLVCSQPTQNALGRSANLPHGCGGLLHDLITRAITGGRGPQFRGNA